MVIHDFVQKAMQSNDVLESELLAARILSDKGLIVFSNLIKPVSESINDIENNSDISDLIIYKKGVKGLFFVEVKRLSSTNKLAYFTEAKDFINGVIIDGVRQYEKKLYTPYAYLIFNQPMTYYITIYTETFDNWRTIKTNGNSSTKDYYVANVTDCKFEKTPNYKDDVLLTNINTVQE